jgi:hypothetical protein
MNKLWYLPMLSYKFFLNIFQFIFDLRSSSIITHSLHNLHFIRYSALVKRKSNFSTKHNYSLLNTGVLCHSLTPALDDQTDRSTGGKISTVTNIRGSGAGADITWVWGVRKGGEAPGATCGTECAMWGWEASVPPDWCWSRTSYWPLWDCGGARWISAVIRGDGITALPTVAAAASWNNTSKNHHSPSGKTFLLRLSWWNLCIKTEI